VIHAKVKVIKVNVDLYSASS